MCCLEIANLMPISCLYLIVTLSLTYLYVNFLFFSMFFFLCSFIFVPFYMFFFICSFFLVLFISSIFITGYSNQKKEHLFAPVSERIIDDLIHIKLLKPPFYRIKFVQAVVSVCGYGMPFFFPVSKQRIIQTIFLARFLIVCIPSSSCEASSACRP